MFTQTFFGMNKQSWRVISTCTGLDRHQQGHRIELNDWKSVVRSMPQRCCRIHGYHGHDDDDDDDDGDDGDPSLHCSSIISTTTTSTTTTIILFITRWNLERDCATSRQHAHCRRATGWERQNGGTHMHTHMSYHQPATRAVCSTVSLRQPHVWPSRKRVCHSISACQAWAHIAVECNTFTHADSRDKSTMGMGRQQR